MNYDNFNLTYKWPSVHLYVCLSVHHTLAFYHVNSSRSLNKKLLLFRALFRDFNQWEQVSRSPAVLCAFINFFQKGFPYSVIRFLCPISSSGAPSNTLLCFLLLSLFSSKSQKTIKSLISYQALCNTAFKYF